MVETRDSRDVAEQIGGAVNVRRDATLQKRGSCDLVSSFPTKPFIIIIIIYSRLAFMLETASM
jgi:hypothetical protein